MSKDIQILIGVGILLYLWSKSKSPTTLTQSATPFTGPLTPTLIPGGDAVPLGYGPTATLLIPGTA
jgi:hypothetical protein